jgi:hypothetical protein
VTWRSLEGTRVLRRIETGACFTVNETETAVWKLFDGANSLAEIEQALRRRFDVEPEEARSDLVVYLYPDNSPAVGLTRVPAVVGKQQ